MEMKRKTVVRLREIYWDCMRGKGGFLFKDIFEKNPSDLILTNPYFHPPIAQITQISFLIEPPH